MLTCVILFLMLFSREKIAACIPLGQAKYHWQGGWPPHIPERNEKHIKSLQTFISSEDIALCPIVF